MTDIAKSAYLKLSVASIAAPTEFPIAGVGVREAVAECLKDLSEQLGLIILNLLNELDVDQAKVVSKYQLRVDFMMLHIDQEIIDLIDNSAELAAVQDTLKSANKKLKKIKDDTANLAANLDRATAILGEFEKLVNWVKAH